ncbi:MAG: YifB family Mg chelatase-like AAA ATPase [Clostridia bacterium]|nr:YifB family Mg chelatase-like AAA ATPase [Clostridia bacterium]
MISKVKSCALIGLNGHIVEVETDISSGLPCFDIVGLPDTSVRESKERVRAAIKNSNFQFPIRRITVNLAPADIRKEGSNYDLPIAISILNCMGILGDVNIRDFVILGELSLDGHIRAIKGALPMAISIKQLGYNDIIVPAGNAGELSLLEGLNIYPVDTLIDVVEFLTGTKRIAKISCDRLNLKHRVNTDDDFSDVKGQQFVKRGLEIGAAGSHNIIMIGPPGSGKTMLARRIPTILPDMTFDEAMEVTKIHSIAGKLNKASIITIRPFRTPHHTISNSSLVGGGVIPGPGEVSLAHRGVLFLDEIPEFKRDALEVLRQPLEDGKVTIARVNATVTFPAEFMLVASMNPCPCGYFGDLKRECRCTPNQIRRYLGKISGPMLDRIDIQLEVPALDYQDMVSKEKNESSAQIKERVDKAREIQLDRYRKEKIYFNSQLSTKLIKKYCMMDKDSKKLLENAFEKLKLSMRAYNKIIKIARTVADIEGEEWIRENHIAEVIQYRTLDRKYWTGKL